MPSPKPEVFEGTLPGPTLEEQLDRSTSPQQVAVTLVGVLGGLALLLATIELYVVMSYAVSQSTRELGLRMALGAGASKLFRLVMSRGLALTSGGVALGPIRHARCGINSLHPTTRASAARLNARNYVA
jgi:hypothetical protein